MTRKKIQTIIMAGGLVLSSFSLACNIKSSLCLNGCCPNKKNISDPIADHSIYILDDNCQTKYANWVAYQVKKENLNGGSKPRKWKQDEVLPPQCTLSPADYKGAYAANHYDRGHQAPLASFSGNPNWEMTNLLSNITPQKANLNRGAWLKGEAAVRKLTNHYPVVFVVTGPLYEKPMPALPNAAKTNQVPSGYFKVIAVQTPGALKVAAFIMPQTASRSDTLCQYQTNLKEVEQKEGETIFPLTQKPIQPLSHELGCD